MMRVSRLLAVFLALALALLATARHGRAARVAPPKKPAAKAAPAAPHAPDPAGGAKAQVAWDAWYTVTVGKSKYGYYNDRVELRQGRIFFQNKYWKNEEGFLNEESLGAYAMDDARLTPLFFNFRQLYRSTETLIDGNVSEQGILSVRVRRAGSELPPIRKSTSDRAIFASMFPLWLRVNLPKLKPTSPQGFQTIREDDVEGGFGVISGLVRLEKPDERATRTGTSRVWVQYGADPSTWWVEKSGMAIRIENAAQKLVVEKVTEAEARKFLDARPTGK